MFKLSLNGIEIECASPEDAFALATMSLQKKATKAKNTSPIKKTKRKGSGPSPAYMKKIRAYMKTNKVSYREAQRAIAK